MTFVRSAFPAHRPTRLGFPLFWAVLALATGWFPWGPVLPRVYAAAPPTIVSPSTARGVVNQSFNYQIVLANFATGTYSAEGLPDGLTLDAKVGAISGVPTAIDTYSVKLTVTNADGTATSTLTLTVEPALPPKVTTAASVVTAVSGQPFSYQIQATNQPTAYTADPLPDGLILNTEAGLISGVPTTTGAYPLNLSATNVRGTGTGTLQLSVVPAIPTVSLVADVPVANPVRGEKGQFTLTRSGGDLSQPLVVVFSVKGTASNGVDYQLLPLAKTIKANKLVKHIHIVPFDLGGDAFGGAKTIKLSLQTSDAYLIEGKATGKVKINYAP